MIDRLRYFAFRALRARHNDGAREDVAAILRGLEHDRERIDGLLRPFWTAFPGTGPAKYLNLDEWLFENCLRARWCGLHKWPSSHVLDLGCGMGFFMLAARRHGHTVLGVDLSPFAAEPIHPLYDAAAHAFDFNYRGHRITPTFDNIKGSLEFEPADLVSSWMTTFHDGWTAGDWSSFFHNARIHWCGKNARIVVELARTEHNGPDFGMRALLAGYDRDILAATQHAPNLVSLRVLQ